MTTTIIPTKPLRIEKKTKTKPKRRRQNPNMTVPVPNLILDPLPVFFLPLPLRPLLVLWSSKVYPPLHGLLSFSGLRVFSAVPRRYRHAGLSSSGGGGGGRPCRVGLSLRCTEEQAGGGSGSGGGGSTRGGRQPPLQYVCILSQLGRHGGDRLRKTLRCCLRYKLGQRFFSAIVIS